MEAELATLAGAGATALVQAMATDAWEDALQQVTQLFRRTDQHSEVIALAQTTGDLFSGATADPTDVTAQWRARLRDLLEGDPGAAGQLRAVLAELVPDADAGGGAGPAASPDAEGVAVEVPAAGVRNSITGGLQGNVIQATSINSLTFHASSLQSALPDPDGWPRTEDVDPVALGVRPTYRLPDLPQLPPYVIRDRDDALIAAVTRAREAGGLVLVLGEPFAGKSRTALEAMVQGLAGFRVFAPARGTDLRGLPALLQGRPGRYVLWLDDLDGHLGDAGGGLEPRLLAQLTALRVTVLATMREDAYDEHRHTPHGRVLDLATVVELAREWSPIERDRLARRAARADDPRLGEVLWAGGPEGAAAYLALGPLLWDEWWRARRADRHPRGHALVRAALDLARCGLRRPLPMDLLVKVHEGYADVTGMDRESLADALAWATERRHGLLRFLIRGTGDTWRAAPFLRHAAARHDTLPPVDGQIWGCALEVARTDDAYDYGAIAAAAREAFRRAAEAGDDKALHNLGVLAESLGERAEAEEWFRRAADGGQAQSAGRLGRMLADRGEGRAAEPYLELAAEAGDTEAATLLGKLLRTRAERWLGVAKEGGSAEAAYLWGDLRLAAGDDTDAFDSYHDAILAGCAEAAGRYGSLILLWNEHKMAAVWLRRAADAGDKQAAERLYDNFEAPPSLDTVETELKEHAAEGRPLAAANYGVLLELQDRPDEARPWHVKAYESGDPYGAFRLAELHKRAGEPGEAQAWYRKAAALGHPGAERALGEDPGAGAASGGDTVSG
ncbi:tetratricopeptide repeat protein [Streptomyces endophytica]|uniref:Tetratricopeptide repeat protein n=1 Tax=Streptomyces endophytica TaxID=2991496 RepID=A0ABY6PB96_9ACTN|nr:tetratricopeptide repeat protein [Streptomyces endophytica]UZJ31061.1 tetratricopeptide repeat protein [Streptomyces endophytica]